MLTVVVVAAVALVAAVSGPAVEGATAVIRSAATGGEGPVARLVVFGLAGLFTFFTVFLPLPAEASALVNGTVFPSTQAFLFTWAWAMAGATASYEIGRRYGRTPARRLFAPERLDRIEVMIERAGWPMLLALRLSPVMAFTAINWASGILALSRPVYYWTTALGLVPGTYVFTVVPELTRGGDADWRLVLIAVATMSVLLGVAFVRWHRER